MADLDSLPRDQLEGAPAAVAFALDDWLMSLHGTVSSKHGAGLFLELLAAEGYSVVKTG